MIATTNNPQQLDPAVNNRPGRFDLVLEMPRVEPAAEKLERIYVDRMRTEPKAGSIELFH